MSGKVLSVIKSESTNGTAVEPQDPVALVDEKLTLRAFDQLAGSLAGYPFVKVVFERGNGRFHVLNNAHFAFHADYVAEHILHIPRDELRAKIDDFNRQVYLSPDRPYVLGVLARHEKEGEGFFTLETVEIDNMDESLLLPFFNVVKAHLDQSLPLFFKPANHHQEQVVAKIDPLVLPRLYNHELYATKDFVALNAGEAKGRLRLLTEETYRRDASTLKWYDILCMDRVPDDVPRVSGILNSEHTTPLSHTNVLACGWGVPNSVQLQVRSRLQAQGLDGKWVRYVVNPSFSGVILEPTEAPPSPPERPAWSLNRIRLEEPETTATPVMPLDKLRMSDRFRYGTKAANLGELTFLLEHGSPRLIGFYRIPRAPRPNLLPYLADLLGAPRDPAGLPDRAWKWLRGTVEVPRGIALPFSLQQEFLQSSWKIQQAIGKLKMALELNAKEIEPLCLLLQQLIRGTRLADKLRDYIDEQIAVHLAGVRSFVVRSSSNAEDLKDFSAAGIYESINHVTTADRIFESVKEVWASLVSPRSVRLRQEVGLSLDDCYMGVVIQEEVTSDMGGVLVTTNPTSPQADFRNVYVNVSDLSAVEVVSGKVLPHQCLFNTVEGGGRTLALGSSGKDLSNEKKAVLQRLSLAGRLLQSHFSQDYAFSSPVDIEWAALGEKIYILQLRPYSV